MGLHCNIKDIYDPFHPAYFIKKRGNIVIISADFYGDGNLVSGRVRIGGYGNNLSVDGGINWIIGPNDSNTGVSHGIIDPIKGNIFIRIKI